MTRFEVTEALEERGTFTKTQHDLQGYIQTFTDLQDSKEQLQQHITMTRLLSDAVRKRGLIDDPTLDKDAQFLFDDIDTGSTIGLLILARALSIVKAQ